MLSPNRQTTDLALARQATYIVSVVRIGEPARKHGVGDWDMYHAWRNPMRRIDSDDDFSMLIGPDTAGRMLEIGVLDIDGDPVIIHAMPLRPKFYEFLGRGGE